MLIVSGRCTKVNIWSRVEFDVHGALQVEGRHHGEEELVLRPKPGTEGTAYERRDHADQFATKYRRIVNLKEAKTLNIAVLASVLAITDEVIE